MSLTKYKDKIQHGIVSMGIFFLLNYLFNLQVGIIVSLLFGIAKEVWDSAKPGNKWDWEDLLFDVLGITLGVWFILGA